MLKNSLFLSLSVFVVSIQAAFAQPTAGFTWDDSCSRVEFTDQSTCNGCTITAWEWDFGDGGQSSIQNPDHNYADSNPYSVTLSISDNLTNVVMVSFDVNPNSTNLQVTTEGTPVSNCGTCDGTMTALPTGGTPPYEYQWGTPFNDITPTAVGVCGGHTYPVLVIDSEGCRGVAEYEMPAFVSDLAVTLDGTPQTDCGVCDGFITATATGGTPPYSYSWSTGFIGSPHPDLCDGLFEVIVTDANGCTASSSTILQSSVTPIIVLDSITHINCLENNSYGSIALHVEGGTPPYNYAWDNGPSFSSDPPPLTGLDEGTWTLTVTDDASCISSSQNFTVSNTSNLYLSTNSISANCGSNGSALVNAQGLHPPYTYLWNDPLQQTTQTAVGLAGGAYEVLVKDAIGCERTGFVSVSENCTSFIQGTVYNDANQNCIQDAGELGISNRIVRVLPNSTYAVTDINGNYTLETLNATEDIGIVNNTQVAFTCPSTGVLNVSVPTLGDTVQDVDFGLYSDPNNFNLVLHPGWQGATPGFDKKYWICYYNSINTSLLPRDVTVRFVYDPALTYLSCTQGGVHDAQTNSIEWQFNALQPSHSWNWYTKPLIYFNVPASMEITDTLCSYFEILPISGDVYPYNNTLSICEPVTGSRDPNAKDVIPRGEGEEGFILPTDTSFFYTVHFQNNGNDTAFTVVVKDTLSEFLDPATIVAGAASHPYSFDLTGHGVLTFRFDEIMLPDSTTNEPESHGYFNFTINAKPGLTPGTVIENTAGIYFDFNEAIITNTTVNTIYTPVAVAEVGMHHGVSVYPNPTSNAVTVESVVPSGVYTLYDVLGKRMMTAPFSASRFVADLSSFSNGVYFISIGSGAEETRVKVVKK